MSSARIAVHHAAGEGLCANGSWQAKTPVPREALILILTPPPVFSFSPTEKKKPYPPTSMPEPSTAAPAAPTEPALLSRVLSASLEVADRLHLIERVILLVSAIHVEHLLPRLPSPRGGSLRRLG